ncbi:SGNH hydrolase [Massarina eburnea CBS 473.64]|uniref:SGNH hydrolase n=1 Tax=Massarina eburnea CBS 473.64 TaxID=1395130 RepID=A0A6A6S0J5_9PLEO|nr:SGNH hydrolase [Massarina eburnea CBS 473.64]
MASQLALLTLAFLSSFANAAPVANAGRVVGSIGGELPVPSRFNYPLDKRDKKMFPLKVMPLGASISFGMGSVDKNGYRKAFRDRLRFEGWEVDMVGGVQSGDFNDNDVQGHPGARLDEVAKIVETAVQYQPNLIAVNVGTNDAAQNKTEFPVETYGVRMEKMLDTIFEKIPGTTVLYSTVLQNANPDTNSRAAKSVNPQIRRIVEKRRKAGQRIVLAEMFESDTPWLNTGDMNKDGTHPTDAGFRKMATIWWDAFLDADKSHMLQPPHESTRKVLCADGDTGKMDTTHVTTTKDFFNSVNPLQNVKLSLNKSEPTMSVWRLDGQGIYVYRLKDGKYTDGAILDIKTNCLAKDVRWFDVNNDGVEDFVCLGPDNETYVQLNQGDNAYPPTFKDVGKCIINRTGDDGPIVDPKLPARPAKN